MNHDQALIYAIEQNEKHSDTEAMIALRSTLILNLDKFSDESRAVVIDKIAEIESELDESLFG